MSAPDEKPWLDSQRPLLSIRFLNGKAPKLTPGCLWPRKRHSWVYGRCWWCGKVRGK